MKEKVGFKKWLTTRGLDMLPGLITWAVILWVFVGSFFIPDIVASFVVFFNIYWVVKTLQMSYRFIKSYIKIKVWNLIDWNARAKALKSRDMIIKALKEERVQVESLSYHQIYEKNYETGSFAKLPFLIELPLIWMEKRYYQYLMEKEFEFWGTVTDDEVLWDSSKVIHFHIVPMVNEAYEILKPNLESVAHQDFGTDQIVMLLATEGRKPVGQEVAKQLIKEYGSLFKDTLMTVHDITPDEIVGKASNMRCGGLRAAELIKEKGWDERYITFTSCDCDSQFSHNYYSALTYEFCKNPNRYTCYFYAAMSFYGNIWDVPPYVRVTNTFGSIVPLAQHSAPNLIQMSTYTGSYKLIKSIDFWSKDVIPEDWNMFFKALFKYGRKVRVIPLYFRTLGDAALDINQIKTVVNQYEQIKRWAWGVSDVPWIIRAAFSFKKGLGDRLYVYYRVAVAIIDHAMWPLYGLVLSFGANIPTMVNERFAYTVYGRSLPRIASFILTFSSVTFLLTLLLDATLKPAKPGQRPFFRRVWDYIVYCLEFLFTPLIGIVFGSLPAIESHSRLLIGKRLEYRLTEKQKTMQK